MIVHILSVLDFICAVVLISSYFVSLPVIVVLYCAAYLILKGAMFFSNVVSAIDLLIGLWLLITLLGFSHFISVLMGVWLISKSLAGLIFA